MLVFFILIALLRPAAAWAQSTSLGIDAGSGVQIIAVDRSRGNAVFSLSALELLGAHIETDSRSARLTWFDQTHTFEIGSPYFRVGSDVFQLVVPARRSGSSMLVSTQLLTEWLPQRYPDKLVLREGVLRARQPAKPVAATRSATPTKTKVERIVVIDAGHGGKDSGKIGAGGLAEKTVVLTVATKLAALLRDRGYEVHLTRTTDTLIALADRPHMANQWKDGRPAALFVSIHANAGHTKAQGYETYFLSEARTEDERRVAEMENAAVAYEEPTATKGPAIEQLLTGLRNDYYQRASNDFAEVIQRELAAFHPGPGRGVKQAGFRVLVGAVMPAVLVEIAFISNPAEARLLGTAAFQDKIAWGLSRSITSFFDSHEHLWAATRDEP
jgi:N-acetylmuramoyl-L-alanine amidase